MAKSPTQTPTHYKPHFEAFLLKPRPTPTHLGSGHDPKILLIL